MTRECDLDGGPFRLFDRVGEAVAEMAVRRQADAHEIGCQHVDADCCLSAGYDQGLIVIIDGCYVAKRPIGGRRRSHGSFEEVDKGSRPGCRPALAGCEACLGQWPLNPEASR